MKLSVQSLMEKKKKNNVSSLCKHRAIDRYIQIINVNTGSCKGFLLIYYGSRDSLSMSP